MNQTIGANGMIMTTYSKQVQPQRTNKFVNTAAGSGKPNTLTTTYFYDNNNGNANPIPAGT